MVNLRVSVRCRVGSEVGITAGGEDTLVTQDFLDGQQIDPGFNQMGGITVAQAVQRNLFFSPQSATTW